MAELQEVHEKLNRKGEAFKFSDLTKTVRDAAQEMFKVRRARREDYHETFIHGVSRIPLRPQKTEEDIRLTRSCQWYPLIPLDCSSAVLSALEIRSIEEPEAHLPAAQPKIAVTLAAWSE